MNIQLTQYFSGSTPLQILFRLSLCPMLAYLSKFIPSFSCFHSGMSGYRSYSAFIPTTLLSRFHFFSMYSDAVSPPRRIRNCLISSIESPDWYSLKNNNIVKLFLIWSSSVQLSSSHLTTLMYIEQYFYYPALMSSSCCSDHSTSSLHSDSNAKLLLLFWLTAE